MGQKFLGAVCMSVTTKVTLLIDSMFHNTINLMNVDIAEQIVNAQ
jgi:hypothetical protein